jgi:hypothetical protein
VVLSRQCGILNILQPYRPPRPVTGIAYSQVVSNNTSEAKHSTSTENMLAQIMQMLKDQNLRLSKIELSIKMTNKL